MKKPFLNKIFAKDFRLIVFIYLLFLVFNLVIIYISPNFLPQKERYFIFQISPILTVFSNFDGLNYTHIGTFGYGDFQQAFFPLYPLLIFIVSKVFSIHTFFAGLLISNLSFIAALYLLLKSFTKIFDREKAIWLILLLISFPTSFFFNSLYTESLFLLLMSLSLYFFLKKKYAASLIPAFFLGATRITGIFAGAFLVNYKKLLDPKNIVVLIPVGGFVLYGFYLLNRYGDFLAFLSAQANFNLGRSTQIILLPQVYFRYLKILAGFQPTTTHFVALSEFIVFNLFFFVLLYYLYRLWKSKNEKYFSFLFGLTLFSLFNILLGTLTGTFLSVTRFAILSISFFIFLSLVKSEKIKIIILIFFLFFHVVFLLLFSQGYFIG